VRDVEIFRRLECDTLLRLYMIDDPRTESTGPGSKSNEGGMASRAEASPAVARFRLCRWHATPEGGGVSYCSHRDVLPFAGMTGFSSEAWCPDCKFYKVRRLTRKQSDSDWKA